jgi:hypothetical protein
VMRRNRRAGRRIDPDEYPPIKGMEGPFSFRKRGVLYYDPKEGRYYDRGRDMYLDRDDVVEGNIEEGCAGGEIMVFGRCVKGLKARRRDLTKKRMDKVRDGLKKGNSTITGRRKKEERRKAREMRDSKLGGKRVLKTRSGRPMKVLDRKGVDTNKPESSIEKMKRLRSSIEEASDVFSPIKNLMARNMQTVAREMTRELSAAAAKMKSPPTDRDLWSVPTDAMKLVAGFPSSSAVVSIAKGTGPLPVDDHDPRVMRAAKSMRSVKTHADFVKLANKVEPTLSALGTGSASRSIEMINDVLALSRAVSAYVAVHHGGKLYGANPTKTKAFKEMERRFPGVRKIIAGALQ